MPVSSITSTNSCYPRSAKPSKPPIMPISASAILICGDGEDSVSYVEEWEGGDGGCCRLLVGMQPPPEETFRRTMRLNNGVDRISRKTALQLKKKLAEEFREQLTIGVPTREDEKGLRQLAQQIRDDKVKVKLFLRHPSTQSSICFIALIRLPQPWVTSAVAI